MRFSAQDVKRLQAAIRVFNGGDGVLTLHNLTDAIGVIAELGPRLIDAYCTAVGLETPAK